MEYEFKAANQDALAIVHARNAFYKKKYHYMLGIAALCLAVISILSGILYYLSKFPPKPYYFAVDDVGRLVSYTPLDQPSLSTGEVADWVTDAVETTYSYDFVNYRTQMQNAEKYFTTYGWRNYMRSLDASNNLLALTSRRMVVVAKVVGKPELLRAGVLGGAYAWRMRMAVLVTYMLPPYNDENKFENPLVVTAIVQRQNPLTSYRGLGLVQLFSQLVVAPAAAELPPNLSS